MKSVPIIIVTLSNFALTGCMLPGGYSGMMDSLSVPSMGATSYLSGSTGQSGRMGVGGGEENVNGTRRGSGGLSGVIASEFARNVTKLEVGKSTKEDAIVILGSPAMKNKWSGHETWQYHLDTGGMPGSGFLKFNNSGVLTGIQVMKISVSGGGIETETVYTRGDM